MIQDPVLFSSIQYISIRFELLIGPHKNKKCVFAVTRPFFLKGTYPKFFFARIYKKLQKIYICLLISYTPASFFLNLPTHLSQFFGACNPEHIYYFFWSHPLDQRTVTCLVEGSTKLRFPHYSSIQASFFYLFFWKARFLFCFFCISAFSVISKCSLLNSMRNFHKIYNIYMLCVFVLTYEKQFIKTKIAS